MPQVLKTVDRIAREKGQTILMVDFSTDEPETFGLSSKWDRAAQSRFIKWLERELPKVAFEKVYPPLDRGVLIWPYMGHLAVIVSESEQPDAYRCIVKYWENEDGTPKFEHTKLYMVPTNLRPDSYYDEADDIDE